MRWGRVVLGMLAAAALSPAALPAQYVSNAHGPLWDRFEAEPYAGRYFDNVNRAGSGFDQSGWMGGVRLGLAIADRARLLGDVAYSQVGEVGQSTLGTPIGSENWLASGGLELDLVPGDTRASVGLQYGAAWRALRFGDEITDPLVQQDTGWRRAPVLVPSFSVRQRIAPRGDLRLGVQNYIYIEDDPISHNFALTAGITLR